MDEYLGACLLEDNKNLQKLTKRVIVQHIELGVQNDLDMPLSDDDSDILSIEVGLKQSLHNTHSLFLVTKDSMGRPHAAWAFPVVMDETLGLSRLIVPPIPLYRIETKRAWSQVVIMWLFRRTKLENENISAKIHSSCLNRSVKSQLASWITLKLGWTMMAFSSQAYLMKQ